MFVSVGIRAMYVSPVDALHGDVGVMSGDDLLVLFSKSGQTAELLNLLPAARNKRVYTIAVVSNRDAAMARQCDTRCGARALAARRASRRLATQRARRRRRSIFLPLQKELCPFDLAPTTSSIVQLIFGNTVVAAIMDATQLTREQYALNHPAGRIGKRLTVKVDDVMKPAAECAVCAPGDKLLDVIGVMSAKRCGCLLVVEKPGQTLVGIFTDGDLRRAIEKGGADALQQPMHTMVRASSLSLVQCADSCCDATRDNR